MSQNDFSTILANPKSLIQDEYYFKFIFKKTEKIICAVFYILQSAKDIQGSQELVRNVERYGADTLAFVADTLSLPVDHAGEAARALSFKLVGLESQLRMLNAAGILHAEHLQVFSSEIDSALRSAKSYGWTTELPKREKEEVPRRAVVKQADRNRSAAGTATHEDRRSKILSVLKAQPGASIKDISDTVKDCSEKTIQRELISLIKDGIVMREGERRWSTYRVV